VTPLTGGGYNVQWTPYIIENKKTSISTYNIYSGNLLSELQLLEKVSGSVTTYSLAKFTDSMYIVGAELSTGKSVEKVALGNYIGKADISTEIKEKNIDDDITVSAFDGQVMVITKTEVNIKIFNSLGQGILSTKDKTFTLDKGIYFIHISTPHGNMMKKILL
jgi:hypothetical protein